MTLLMKSEFAAHQGVGASAVSNWAKKGLLVFGADPARPGKELVDVEKSVLLIRGTIDQTRGRPRSAEAAQVEQGEAAVPAAATVARVMALSGPEAARMEEMRERTLGRRIENEKNLGRLVQLPEVERRTADRGRLIRERTLSLLRQQSERVAAETDPRKIYALQAEEFEQLFTRLADEIEAEASAEAQADAVLATIADNAEDDEAEAA
ncbi:hypothetical protein [Brevundimonas subvibrioides]|uniref:Terminase small subunit n=1 Tax=Brevundimonas subvibrioides (strain ATCC 15264 / DSM 4735 / LMG 14903 / NBRC 16000 / CB 81) TaxID=633149 RepID=D9QI96_BRESC|nr:hypothetical protein [Brevundimonas subvibrioides]ADK99398.1 conserved hypothetical protein [Brevundimonas subvibrioides ATCC 15264]